MSQTASTATTLLCCQEILSVGRKCGIPATQMDASFKKEAERILSHSLLDPTDNSRAQATWLAANKSAVSLEIPDDDYLIARSYEANAYRAFLALDWDSSLVSSLKWMKDHHLGSLAYYDHANGPLYLQTSIHHAIFINTGCGQQSYSPSPQFPSQPRLDVGAPFGLRLKALRVARGMTQARMAKRFGIDRGFISEVERGKKGITLATIEIVSLGFKVSISKLMNGLGAPSNSHGGEQ